MEILPLVQSSTHTLFEIEFKDQDFEVTADFKVYEVTAWDLNSTVCEKELYITGTIKWDGCCHITFGGEDKDGYIHLCGKGCFDNHVKVMNALWDICSKRIKRFDFDIAS